MEWQQILGFYHVEKLKSFTRAAEATYRTQSAIQRQSQLLCHNGVIECRTQLSLCGNGTRCFFCFYRKRVAHFQKEENRSCLIGPLLNGGTYMRGYEKR